MRPVFQDEPDSGDLVPTEGSLLTGLNEALQRDRK